MHHPLVIATINADQLKEQLEQAARARAAREVRRARRARRREASAGHGSGPRYLRPPRPAAAPSVVIARGFNC